MNFVKSGALGAILLFAGSATAQDTFSLGGTGSASINSLTFDGQDQLDEIGLLFRRGNSCNNGCGNSCDRGSGGCGLFKGLFRKDSGCNPCDQGFSGCNPCDNGKRGCNKGGFFGNAGCNPCSKGMFGGGNCDPCGKSRGGCGLFQHRSRGCNPCDNGSGCSPSPWYMGPRIGEPLPAPSPAPMNETRGNFSPDAYLPMDIGNSSQDRRNALRVSYPIRTAGMNSGYSAQVVPNMDAIPIRPQLAQVRPNMNAIAIGPLLAESAVASRPAYPVNPPATFHYDGGPDRTAPADPSATFPYDGGPRHAVPMPINNSPRDTNPSSDRPSVPRRAT